MPADLPSSPRPAPATPPPPVGASDPTPASGQNPSAPVVPLKVRAALGRYRIAAFVVGVGLLILCVAVVLKYVFKVDQAVVIWGPIHGALYVAYVLLAFDLAYKDRWSLIGIIKVLLAGVIPFVSFIAERWVHRLVLARRRI